jgi:hypothetical protein
MLNPDLLNAFLDEVQNKPWVPEFAGDAKVLATPHESIGLAAFGSCGNALGGEVILLATGDGDEPGHDESVSDFDAVRSFNTYLPCATKAYSRVTVLAVTMVSPRGARPQAPGPNALFKIRRYLISGK